MCGRMDSVSQSIKSADKGEAPVRAFLSDYQAKISQLNKEKVIKLINQMDLECEKVQRMC